MGPEATVVGAGRGPNPKGRRLWFLAPDPPRSLLVSAAAATLAASVLCLFGGPLAPALDDLQELLAAGGAAGALAIAARGNLGPGRAISAAMSASVGAAFVGMLLWDLSNPFGSLLTTAGDLVFVVGALVGVAAIAAAVFGGIHRDRLIGVAIDTLIVFLGGVAIVAALWREEMVPPADRLATAGAVLLLSAAAGCMFALFNRGIGWSTPGPWIALAGALDLGASWLMWVGGLASPSRIDASDFMFSAGLLMIAFGVVAWDTRPSASRAFEQLSSAFSAILPIAAIVVCLALLAITRGPDFADLLGFAATAAIVTSAVRQLHLFRREAHARAALAVRTAELQAAAAALELEIGERQRLETEQEAMHVRMVESQRLESIGRLAGGVAHDFNNLLTAIRGFADLAGRRLPADDEGQDDLAALRHATDQAASLTAQLLAFSRNQRLRPTVMDLGEVVARMEPLLHRLLGEQVELTVRSEPSLHRVLADAGQIESIIVNLAVNGRDAMERGGGLTIEVANVDLDARADVVQAEVSPGPYVMLAVSDSGSGMDPETLSHVFEPFFTTKGPGHGTGLGLAVVYGTVRQSGGYVGVTSRSGVGTTFRIFLPPTELPLPAVRDHDGVAPAHRSRPESILLVEDEEPVRAMVAAALVRFGYSVVAVGNGEAAVAELDRNPDFGVLLTDVVMPGMSGIELAAKAHVLRPGLPVICMSGYTPPDLDPALTPGVRFLAKPFTLGKLEQLMREVVGD